MFGASRSRSRSWRIRSVSRSSVAWARVVRSTISRSIASRVALVFRHVVVEPLADGERLAQLVLRAAPTAARSWRDLVGAVLGLGEVDLLAGVADPLVGRDEERVGLSREGRTGRPAGRAADRGGGPRAARSAAPPLAVDQEAAAADQSAIARIGAEADPARRRCPVACRARRVIGVDAGPGTMGPSVGAAESAAAPRASTVATTAGHEVAVARAPVPASPVMIASSSSSVISSRPSETQMKSVRSSIATSEQRVVDPERIGRRRLGGVLRGGHAIRGRSRTARRPGHRARRRVRSMASSMLGFAAGQDAASCR